MICTYKKCGSSTNVFLSKRLRGKSICSECYKMIKERRNFLNSDRLKNDESFRKRKNNIQLEYYNRQKKDPLKFEKLKKEMRIRSKRCKDLARGTIHARFKNLQEKAREKKIKNNISKDLLNKLIQSEKCYVSGIKISQVSPFFPYAYFLDRIGLPEFGGNGKKGGDYDLKNIRVVSPIFNLIREQFHLSHEEMEKLFKPIRDSSDNEIKEILLKIILAKTIKI
jgi:hypothetical protein